MGYLTCKYNAHTRPGQLDEKSYLTAHNFGRNITYISRSTSVRDSNTPILDLLLSLTVIDLLS